MSGYEGVELMLTFVARYIWFEILIFEYYY
jgi:hypothetical protein